MLKRMAKVRFSDAVKAVYQADDLVREAFFSEVVLKRLHGRIDRLPSQMGRLFPFYDVENVLRKVPGHLYCRQLSGLPVENLLAFPQEIRSKIKYINFLHHSNEFTHFPNLITNCFSFKIPNRRGHRFVVHYRPALLNGRHVVDVLKVVRRRSDVSEAELDRARREATENASETTFLLERGGVWTTYFIL